MRLNTKTVDNFNILYYLGLWYQIATIPSWFQRNLVRVTAEYSLRPDGKITVDNIGYGRITGLQSRVVGVAEKAEPNIESWLKVRFFFGKADYFVLELDPYYQWALVGGNDPDSLWILCRENKMPIDLFNQLKENARNRGYNVDKLIVV
jgi:lipocalin